MIYSSNYRESGNIYFTILCIELHTLFGQLLCIFQFQVITFLKRSKARIFPKKGQIKRFSESCRFRTLAATGLESDMKTASISRFGPFLNLNRFWKRLNHLEEANGQNCWPEHREDCRGGVEGLRCVAAAAPFLLPAYWPPLEESRRVSARRCSAPRTRLKPSAAAAAPFLALKMG